MLKYGAFASLQATHPSNVAKGLLPVHLTAVYPGFDALSFYSFRASSTVKFADSLMLGLLKSVKYAGRRHW